MSQVTGRSICNHNTTASISMQSVMVRVRKCVPASHHLEPSRVAPHWLWSRLNCKGKGIHLRIKTNFGFTSPLVICIKQFSHSVTVSLFLKCDELSYLIEFDEPSISHWMYQPVLQVFDEYWFLFQNRDQVRIPTQRAALVKWWGPHCLLTKLVRMNRKWSTESRTSMSAHLAPSLMLSLTPCVTMDKSHYLSKLQVSHLWNGHKGHKGID